MAIGSVSEIIANKMFGYAAKISKEIAATYLTTHVKYAFNFN